MSRYEVDSEAMTVAAAGVQATLGTVVAETDRMMRQLETLQQSWQGSAAAAFAGLVAQWRTTQQRVHDSAQGIQTALAQAGRQYADAESVVTRMFTG